MWYDTLIEKDVVPDALLRFGIRQLLAARLREETAPDHEAQQARLMDFVRSLKSSVIARDTEAANEQHYEVPTDFFLRCLGPRMKYSSCYYQTGVTDLARAEEDMLALSVERARVQDGQEILELGCGWGSLSLFLAEKFPAAHITGVSNSRTQREYIMRQAEARQLKNLDIITADINAFQIDRRFDRILSVEMFEHVRNYEQLFAKCASWLKPDGFMFVHIFCHDRLGYPFEKTGDHDWMARYFFTGGIMPAADLFHYFLRDLSLLEQWTVNGTHYEKTCNAWLANMDRHRAELMPLLASTYGPGQALKWWCYWRIFYMACAELFGYRQGKEWYVSHYLFQPRLEPR